MYGIENIGSTCWLSSLLQCLLGCSGFVRWIRLTECSSDRGEVSFTRCFQALADVSDPSREQIGIAVGRLYRLLSKQFIDQGQQDVQEALLYILQGLHRESSRTPTKCSSDRENLVIRTNVVGSVHPIIAKVLTMEQTPSTSMIHFLFQGILFEETRKENPYEPFYTLFCKIHPHSLSEEVNIRHLLAEVCKEQRIIRYPKILIFCIHPSSSWKQTKYRLCREFVIPARRFIGHSSNTEPWNLHYRLRSLSLHQGTWSSGHYTAWRLDHDRWFYCDDHHVYPSEDLPLTITQTPRLLFYERE